MIKKTDNIYAAQTDKQMFSFDGQVAEVFPDMIQRSVPGYSEILKNTAKFAQRFVTNDSHCYDLGCSLGASSLAMSSGITATNVKIIGIDNSEAMLARCHHHIDAYKHQTKIELHVGDILQFPIENASMVVLNFTLQFIAQQQREALLKKIYQGMNVGGILLLSEKVCFANSDDNELMIDLHHQFKRENGYSELEISQKRSLLEKVLVPESLDEHFFRLSKLGFSRVNCWFQQYNFVSIFAIK
ncbi:MAG: tRNA (uridine-5-oxyacetic acid methyl ester) 34 synthase [Osedax symbiont Rs1]|nr:MAG: tRNA (uridine-5-oxyacetic acid methyl ester) 34 synthase [Osedax symbiont Rs1]